MNDLLKQEREIRSQDWLRGVIERNNEQLRNIAATTSPLPRKPAQSVQPTPAPPAPGTEQFIRTVEQQCPECMGSCWDISAVDMNPSDAPDCPECGGTGRVIVTRNYLAESFAIAQNPDSTRPVERAHIVAVIEYARQLVSAAVILPDVRLPEVA